MFKLNNEENEVKRKTRWGWGVLFYGVCVLYYTLLTLYDQQVTETINSLPNSTGVRNLIGFNTYGGKFKYLTTLNLLLQSVYFLLSFSAHLTRHERFREFCEFLFTSAVLPLGILVALVFWVIFAINRELVYPSFLDLYLPLLLNHACHTFIVVLILLDVLLIPRSRPVNLVAESLVVLLTVVCYTTWIIWIRYHAGFWVYPLMNQLTYTQFGLFILFQTGVMYGIQRLGVVFISEMQG